MSLSEAVALHVHDGDCVALEGFTHLIPFAAGHEIIRQRRRDLTLVRLTPDLLFDQMIGAGCASRLVFSWGGNPGVGSLHRFRDAIENGWPRPVAIDEHSHAGLTNRYVAGASNLPFAVLRGYAGTTLLEHSTTVATIECPFTGESLAAVPAVRPDVTIVHAQQADRAGNVGLWGIIGVQKEAVLSARRAIVTVEEIVDELTLGVAGTVLPAWVIDAVVEVPGGSWPSYALGYSERDNAFYQEWDGISRDRERFAVWLDENVYDTDAAGRQGAGKPATSSHRQSRKQPVSALARPHRLVLTGGGELAYRIDGPRAGPVLLLSNSLGTAIEMWDPQVTALSGHFRVVRYDQRGHGASSAPAGPYTIDQLARDALELLDELGCEKASVAGVSLGGMVGMHLAASRPERIDRLVLASTSPYLGPAEQWTERARIVRQGGVNAIAPTILERWFTPAYLSAHPNVSAGFMDMFATCSPEGYAACCEAIAAMDQREALAAIKAPTLVVVGADDPTTTPAAGLELQSAIPGAALAVIPNARHIVNVEQADTFTEAVLGHLAGTAIERGMKVRRSVLGDSYVERATASAAGDAGVAAFQRLISETAWGSVWARPGLDRRTRRMLTLAVLVGLGRLEEFELHARAALADAGDGGPDGGRHRRGPPSGVGVRGGAGRQQRLLGPPPGHRTG